MFHPPYSDQETETYLVKQLAQCPMAVKSGIQMLLCLNLKPTLSTHYCASKNPDTGQNGSLLGLENKELFFLLLFLLLLLLLFLLLLPFLLLVIF